MLELKRNLFDELEGFKTFEEVILVDGQEVGKAYTIVPPADANYDEVYIESLDIEEEFRNSGYGTQALLALKEKYGDVYLAPTDENNKRLYERLGEKVSGEDRYDAIDQGYGVYLIG